MRLAFILGSGKGITEKLDSRIKGMRDNIQTSYFSSLQEMINFSYQRNTTFDRVVLISAVINSPVLIKDFYSYWSNTNTNTNIVLVAKKGHDEDLCKFFLNTFSTPIVACMLLDNTSLQTLGEAVILSPSDLTERYGITDHMNIEVNTGFEYVPETSTEDTKEPKVNEQITQPNNKPEKKGFFSSLFGGKKKGKQNLNENTQPQIQSNQDTTMQDQYQDTTMQDQYQDTTMQDQYQDTTMQDQYQDTTMQDQYQDNDQGISNIYSDNNDIYTEYLDNQVQYDNNNLDNCENYEESTYQSESTTEEISFDENYDEPVSDLIDSTENINVEEQSEFDFSEDFENTNIDNETQSLVEEVDDEFDFSEMLQDEVNSQDNEQSKEPSNIAHVDEDFGNFTISYDTNTPTGNTEEVDEDFGQIGVASEEDAYRQSNEQPKVIEKVVVKEVIRNISTDKKHTALNGVLSGRNKKVIIVTGDRGSGITSTAIALAKTMAQKVNVLYVDFDVDNHGLLSYINYDTFRSYQGVPMQGIKMCKSSKVFNNCIVSYEHNLDILSSDYSCDVTNEEIEQTQGVIAEIADDYNVVVVDCPADKLSIISDLILLGNTILCVEESKRGFMNMLCTLENSPLSIKYKRMIVSRGNMFLTKCISQTDTKKLLKYINAIFESDSVNWMQMEITKFNGKLSDDTLNKIFEA